MIGNVEEDELAADDNPTKAYEVCRLPSASSQGVVTPIGAILKAATGDTTVTRPRRFFLVGHRVTKVFKMAQNGLRCGHEDTGNFEVWSRGHSQI